MNNVGSTTGLVAIPNKSRRYTQWHISQVYGAGNKSTNVHIVNVDDSVVDWENNVLYRVTAVSDTGIPTLEPVSFQGVFGVTVEEKQTKEQTVLSTGPGLCSEGYRLYINTKLIPSPCKIDNRVLIFGSENSYIKLFKGSDITSNGTVVSAVINSAGRMVSENIALEPVVIPHKPNKAVKTILSGYVTEQLHDGEVVTAVVYDNKGAITSRFKLIVVNTEFVRNVDASKKHVVALDLITPYLSSSDKSLIEFPIGMVAQSSSFLGRVTYNDGTTATYPCDGTKFTLFGFDTFLAARLGDTTPLILNYKLSELEYSNNLKLVDDRRFVSKPYKIKTVDSNQRYNVKIYVVPKWNHSTLAWDLEYWLYSLKRDTPINITNHVEYATNIKPFDGKLFGTEQRITIAFNLDRLGAGFSYFRHVETFNITLLHPVTDGIVSSYYQLDYDSTSSISARTTARVTGTAESRTLDLSGTAPDVATLLDAWFYASEPLIYPFNESSAPRPNTLKISVNEWSREITLEEVLEPITGVNAAISHGDSIQVEFLKGSSSNRLYLGRVGLIAVMN